MRLRLSRPWRWRRKGEPAARWDARLVVSLKDDSGVTITRFDLPAVVVEDDNGLYPFIAEHCRELDPPIDVASISISMRHKTNAPTLAERING